MPDAGAKRKSAYGGLDSRYAQDSEWGQEVVSKNSLYVKRVRALRMTSLFNRFLDSAAPSTKFTLSVAERAQG